MPATRQVVDALKHRYAGDSPAVSSVTTPELSTFIHGIPADALPADHSLLDVIASEHSDWIPSPEDRSVLKSIQDCLKLIYSLIDLEPEVTYRLQTATPLIAAAMLTRPTLPVEQVEHSLLTVLDAIVEAVVGWSADQGRAAEKVLTEIDQTLDALRAPQPDYAQIASTLHAFTGKEQSRIGKLEERLSASEAGLMRSRQGRVMAAEMINRAMAAARLTTGIARFLKGPWYESMQLLAITRGVDGEDWVRAVKLTETIIWTYQPFDQARPDDRQRLYQIIEHLPAEIHDLLLVLEHNSDSAETALAEIEADHIAVISGRALEYSDFELISIEQQAQAEKPSVSRILLRKVTALEPGQWFIYDNEGKRARIKLLLKLDEVKQLLFTNRNGMKALDITFDEMAYLMSSAVIRPLTHQDVFSSTARTFYRGLIEAHERKQAAAADAERAAAAEEAARQQALAQAEAAERKQQEEELRSQQALQVARLERAWAEAAKPENRQQVAELTAIVSRLNTGAWLKLPSPQGPLVECKLAVRVGEKLIFVTGSGAKMGDYSVEQLVTLLVAGEAEIADAGVEFEDTLAQVVSKLRLDRTKSYDDLTGRAQEN